MMDHNMSRGDLIEHIDAVDAAGIPGFDDSGSLVDRIISLVNSDIPFSDIFLHEDSPIMLKLPNRLQPVSALIVTADDMKELYGMLDQDWESKIEKRAFDKAINLTHSRIRANCFTYGARRQFGCVVRRFPANPVPLDQLGLAPTAMRLADVRRGLVLIVGDTGQGKSTTIASMLDHINTKRAAHILTFEDPIEQRLTPKASLITQREVGEEGDVESFYLGALDALRERPDVVMIGEIREAEVAREAVALAESGPLVIATMHARSVELAIAKMLRLLGGTDVAAEALSQALRGVLCQSLVPSVTGEKSFLVTELLTMEPSLVGILRQKNYNHIRDLLRNSADPRQHDMTRQLLDLIAQNKVSKEDAMNSTTDAAQLLKQLNQAA